MPAEGSLWAGRVQPATTPEGHPSAPSSPSDKPSSSRSSRRLRWDAGTAVTERDVAALRWIGEQYAARSDVLAALLGRLGRGADAPLARRTLRQVVERWGIGGLIVRYRLLGHQWVVPTKRALRMVGLEGSVWSPVVPQLAHVHAVGIVRLALESSIPEGGRWVSEREMRRDARSHLPDGAVELASPPATGSAADGLLGDELDRPAPRIAIEVELTRKSGARLRDAWTRPRHRRWQRTVYFAPPEVASYLAGQLERIPSRHRIEIRSLPEVPGTTYVRSGRIGGVS
jgi:hypothetical protein